MPLRHLCLKVHAWLRRLCCGQIRAAIKSQKAGKYGAKVKARSKRKAHVAKHPLPRDELADVFK